LLTDVHPDNLGYRERIAGPVLAMTPVADVDEAIGLAVELRPSRADLYGSARGMRAPEFTLIRVTACDSRWFPHAKR
jgi:acyl-CoA reductase-like NAD-dependent aldehyde dehydrogenase